MLIEKCKFLKDDICTCKDNYDYRKICQFRDIEDIEDCDTFILEEVENDKQPE